MLNTSILILILYIMIFKDVYYVKFINPWFVRSVFLYVGDLILIDNISRTATKFMEVIISYFEMKDSDLMSYFHPWHLVCPTKL